MIRPGLQYEDPMYYWEEPGVETEWFGKLGDRLGFPAGSAIDPKDFAALREGRLADGTRLHGAGGRTPKDGPRLLGDFMAAAPKSVSIVGLVLGDQGVVGAHQKAARAALGELEKHIQAWAAGGRLKIHTGEALFGIFHHDASRTNEPHLHSHAPLCNVTFRPDGVFRAVEQREMWNAQRLATAVYRQVLTQELRTLGYRIEFGPQGQPEIAGITRAQIEALSSRRREIVDAAAGKGQLPDFGPLRGRQMGAAASRTQPPKSLPERDQRYAAWRELAAELEIPSLAELRRLGRKTERPVPGPAMAWEAVDQALSHLSERQETFRLMDLKAEGLARARGFATPDDVDAEINRRSAFAPDNPAAIYIAKGWVTTPEAVQSRERIIEGWRAGCGRYRPVFETVPDLEGWGLSVEQADAIRMILSSRDEMVGVVGRAGVGKTHLTKALRQILIDAGWQVAGFAPTGPATRGLQEIQLAADTAQGLASHGPRNTAGRQLWLFDEAGMMDSRLFEAALARSRAAGARIVFLGDPAQHGAVAAGRPFAQLLEKGMQSRLLKDIQRQKDAPELKAVVEAAAEGRMQEALERLSDLGSVVPKRTSQGRLEEAVARYMAASELGTVLVCTGTNAERHAVNDGVRALRIEAGQVAREGVKLECLSPRDLTEVDRRDAQNFRRGDTVVFHHKSGLFRAGERGQVVSSSRARVNLRMADGRLATFNPKEILKLAVYEPIRRELAVGERIEFREAFRNLGIDNGSVGTVRAIQPDSLLVELDRPGEGQRKTFLSMALSFPIALDYGYASTTYRAQGRTVDRVILSTAARYINPEVAYVALSRGRREATLITDDTETAIEVLERVRQQRKEQPSPDEVRRDWEAQRPEHEPEIRLDDQPAGLSVEEEDASAIEELGLELGDGKGMEGLVEKNRGSGIER